MFFSHAGTVEPVPKLLRCSDESDAGQMWCLRFEMESINRVAPTYRLVIASHGENHFCSPFVSQFLPALVTRFWGPQRVKPPLIDENVSRCDLWSAPDISRSLYLGWYYFFTIIIILLFFIIFYYPTKIPWATWSQHLQPDRFAGWHLRALRLEPPGFMFATNRDPKKPGDWSRLLRKASPKKSGKTFINIHHWCITILGFGLSMWLSLFRSS